MNLMVGTIFIASNNNKKRHENDPHNRDSSSQIARVSSFFERLRSMNLSSYTTAAAGDLPGDDCSSSSRIAERVRPVNFSSSTAATAAAADDSQERYRSESKTADCSSTSRLARSILLPSCFKILLELPTREYLSLMKQRSPSQPSTASSLLERAEFNLSSFHGTASAESEQLENSPGQLVRVPSPMDRLESFKAGVPSTRTDNFVTDPYHNVSKSKSDKTGVTPAKNSLAEMKKSLSETRIASERDKEEDVDWRRPATARERLNAADDAKADDFINRFKQQLKLQRLDSVVRFKKMLNRGT